MTTNPSPKPSTTLPVPDPQVVSTEMDDGTAVLLHLDTKFYYNLNVTGARVWKALASGFAGDERALAEQLAREFDVDVEAAERDVRALLADLSAESLVVAAR